ncbi:hypothetical protein B296_00036654 [Ensete ventricosum]|uniref:Uncharacterized protein n=1 Tax=Ensete ventricosum TaxID=4639 RepID=A0A426Z6L8_ENSVE|nr:hypothetical protein B296_00036654 [Ensete ventricosum]
MPRGVRCAAGGGDRIPRPSSLPPRPRIANPRRVTDRREILTPAEELPWRRRLYRRTCCVTRGIGGRRCLSFKELVPSANDLWG